MRGSITTAFVNMSKNGTPLQTDEECIFFGAKIKMKYQYVYTVEGEEVVMKQNTSTGGEVFQRKHRTGFIDKMPHEFIADMRRQGKKISIFKTTRKEV